MLGNFGWFKLGGLKFGGLMLGNFGGWVLIGGGPGRNCACTGPRNTTMLTGKATASTNNMRIFQVRMIILLEVENQKSNYSYPRLQGNKKQKFRLGAGKQLKSRWEIRLGRYDR